MTASTSRPAMTASTASRWPGRNSWNPNSCRRPAATSMGGEAELIRCRARPARCRRRPRSRRRRPPAARAPRPGASTSRRSHRQAIDADRAHRRDRQVGQPRGVDDRRDVGAGVLGRLDLVRPRASRRTRSRPRPRPVPEPTWRVSGMLEVDRPSRPSTAVGEHGREQRRAGDAHPEARDRVGDHRHGRAAARQRHHHGRTERHRRPEHDLVSRQRVHPGGAHRAGRPAEGAQEQRDADEPHSGEGVAGQVDAVREPDLELQGQVGLGAEERDAGAEGGHVRGDRVGRVREHRRGRAPLVPDEQPGGDGRERQPGRRRHPPARDRQQHRHDQPQQHRPDQVERLAAVGRLRAAAGRAARARPPRRRRRSSAG